MARQKGPSSRTGGSLESGPAISRAVKSLMDEVSARGGGGGSTPSTVRRFIHAKRLAAEAELERLKGLEKRPKVKTPPAKWRRTVTGAPSPEKVTKSARKRAFKALAEAELAALTGPGSVSTRLRAAQAIREEAKAARGARTAAAKSYRRRATSARRRYMEPLAEERVALQKTKDAIALEKTKFSKDPAAARAKVQGRINEREAKKAAKRAEVEARRAERAAAAAAGKATKPRGAKDPVAAALKAVQKRLAKLGV